MTSHAGPPTRRKHGTQLVRRGLTSKTSRLPSSRGPGPRQRLTSAGVPGFRRWRNVAPAPISDNGARRVRGKRRQCFHFRLLFLQGWSSPTGVVRPLGGRRGRKAVADELFGPARVEPLLHAESKRAPPDGFHPWQGAPARSIDKQHHCVSNLLGRRLVRSDHIQITSHVIAAWLEHDRLIHELASGQILCQIP